MDPRLIVVIWYRMLGMEGTPVFSMEPGNCVSHGFDWQKGSEEQVVKMARLEVEDRYGYRDTPELIEIASVVVVVVYPNVNAETVRMVKPPQ